MVNSCQTTYANYNNKLLFSEVYINFKLNHVTIFF